jgi:hypothetical protein
MKDESGRLPRRIAVPVFFHPSSFILHPSEVET